jgi:hypothetical protein
MAGRQCSRRSAPQLGPWLFCLAAIVIAPLAGTADTVSYNRDIRPVLSDKCFRCHGPDPGARKAKLRLDVRESAVEKKAIVPGRPEESELIRRITSNRADHVMPPPETHKRVMPSEAARLHSWIAEGAKYERHWAYIPPVKAGVPAGTNAIDYLVQTRLATLGLKPSPEADRRILARRLYFDLVGLPPTPEAVAAFEQDTSPEAYASLVEKLFASPHYGERMAIPWLDVVRFADTIGYHSDNPRNVWPYRDYVIRAFNQNKRFDQFTCEQLAGDLVPESGLEQKVGSAFNRLLLTTEEGGAQPKDYEYRMLTDRVRAVGTVWLGQTLGCAACHDHKFDPVTSRDFYSLGAFFADIKEPIIGPREGGIPVPDKGQEEELTRLRAQEGALQKQFDAPSPASDETRVAWERGQRAAALQETNWTVLVPSKARSEHGAKLKVQPGGSVLAEGPNPDKDIYHLTYTNLPARLAGFRIQALPHKSLPANGPGRAGNGNFVVTEVIARVKHAGKGEERLKFRSARASFEQSILAENNPYKAWVAVATIDDDAKGESAGWAVLPKVGEEQQLFLELEGAPTSEPGDSITLELRQNLGLGSHTLGHFRIAACADPAILRGPLSIPPPAEIARLLEISPEKRTEGQAKAVLEYFKTAAPELAGLRQKLAEAQKAAADYETKLPHCLVTVSTSERRTVHLLPRGNFLSEEAGDIVQAALPAYLVDPKGNAKEGGLNRLDLAKWLVARDNPLTARVVMNRLWKQFFGTGLSKVMEDLGTQGEIPPNQPLLDWLACEFMDSGWDLRHMVRLIVTSHTYKQTSVPTPEIRARDPNNRELACQSRWRLDAELVRDNALAVSGLLELSIGGPSVKVYQPDGYWENLNFPPRTYEQSTGTDQYRRGLYVWWQRSYLHPAMVAFDAPTREECAAERVRSNIPQQALVLLNDPTFVEASRVFAARIIKQGGAEAKDRIRWAWREALARDPDSGEVEVLTHLLEKFQEDYGRDRPAAEASLKVGLQPVPTGMDAAELAAWSHVARAILNLHESITRS